jgi:hypothetical protein
MFKIDNTKLIEVQSAVEREWRDIEISRADIELNKVQDGAGVGTVSEWRLYRVALRNWPTHPEFPKVESRPVAPDLK